MFKTGKSIKAESIMLLPGADRNWEWERTSNGYKLSLGGNENILKLDSSDSCINMQIYLKNHTELYTLKG